MPGPQYLTPKPVSPSRSTKRFTVEEANRTLPLVKRIVGDIVRTHADVTRLQAVVESAATKDQTAAQKALNHAIDHLQAYADELTGIGCELKDYQTGLIDFIGRHEGHDVYLCWKLGEEKIGFWHEKDAGVSGRQPIASLKEGE